MGSTILAESPRLELRELDEQDVSDRYLGWLEDHETSRFLESRFVEHSLESLREWVLSASAHPDTWLLALIARDGLGHIGNVKVGPLNRHHGTAALGILIGEPEARGRGLGSEAIQLATGLVLADPRVRKLTASCYSGNLASQRAFERAGWQREGTRPAQFLDDNQLPHDQVMFGLHRPDRAPALGSRSSTP